MHRDADYIFPTTVDDVETPLVAQEKSGFELVAHEKKINETIIYALNAFLIASGIVFTSRSSKIKLLVDESSEAVSDKDSEAHPKTNQPYDEQKLATALNALLDNLNKILQNKPIDNSALNKLREKLFFDKLLGDVKLDAVDKKHVQAYVGAQLLNQVSGLANSRDVITARMVSMEIAKRVNEKWDGLLKRLPKVSSERHKRNADRVKRTLNISSSVLWVALIGFTIAALNPLGTAVAAGILVGGALVLSAMTAGAYIKKYSWDDKMTRKISRREKNHGYVMPALDSPLLQSQSKKEVSVAQIDNLDEVMAPGK